MKPLAIRNWLYNLHDGDDYHWETCSKTAGIMSLVFDFVDHNEIYSIRNPMDKVTIPASEETTAADEARLGVNPMKSSNHRVGHRAGNLASRTTPHFQMVESSEDKDGGRYRIRTYDFHRVKMALYR